MMHTILLLMPLVVIVITTANETAATSDQCSVHKDCRHCASKINCVWCDTARECRRGSAFGAKHDICMDYQWLQCTVPQFVVIFMVALCVLCCCVLVTTLYCFRGVCCPRSWQSKLSSWKKVRAQHEHDLLEGAAAAANGDNCGAGGVSHQRRPNPRTGLTALETRNKLRGEYQALGMKPNF